ncbi:efflux transporter outer membrane subunit [Azohydromonas aeria]|uniref:efflux transporter outer membrane subunit n=1 Tax=Azohydromonas aeria TaxID=2590212 RepID=UPI001E2AFA27|nr:efflux transporter outer membrane subunit [Azohydromonas aeria]
MKAFMLKPRVLGLAVAAALLAGCASTVAPSSGTGAALPVPATLTAGDVAGTPGTPLRADAALEWRSLVSDARLAQLIELALVNNRDLRMAAANVQAARAQYRINDAARAPTVSAGVGSTASHSLGKTTRQVSASLGTTAWELDLWGRLASLRDAALASYLSTEQTQIGVQSALVAEVGQAWLTLAADRQLEALARQTLDSREQSLALTQRRQALGAVSPLDVATAEAAVQAARGTSAQVAQQLAQDLNALRLLLGAEPPVALLPEAGDQAQAGVDGAAALVAVPAGLPSTMLLRRPDVRAAELSLRAADADVAAARAAFFPTLSLTAAAGTASATLGGLFAAGSGAWSFIPSLALPIFDGGARQGALDYAQAQQQAGLASYDKAIQTAFREVADTLAERASLGQRLAAQQALVEAYATSLRLVTERRRLGAESALAVLDAQRTLWSAQQELVSLRLAEQGNRLTLFKALGGA